MFTKRIGIALCLLVSGVFEPGRAQSLSLADAINRALAHHPALHASAAGIEAARGRFWSGIALPQPEVSASYEYAPSGGPLGNAGEKTYGVTQALEFPTVYLLRGAKFGKEYQAAESESEHARLGVIASVKSAYYEALYRREALKIAEENLAIMEDFKRKSAVRERVGEGTHLESLTARVQHAEAVGARDAQRNHLASAMAELADAMGERHTAGMVYELSDTLGFVRLDPSLERVLDDALRVNRMLRVQSLRAEAAAIDETLAWSELLPKFELGYSRQTLDGKTGFYGATFGITLPIWFMFDQKGKIEEAQANRVMAEAELRRQSNAVALGIEKAFAEFKNEEAQVRLYQAEIIPQSEEIYRTAVRSYEAGEITYLEFLQARQTLITAKSNYAGALYASNRALVSLEEAAGVRFQ